MPFRLKLAQSAGELNGVPERLAYLETQLETHGPDCDLMLLPEGFSCGYNITDQIAELAEPSDGPTAKHISALAQKHNTAILYGYSERAGDTIYNSAQCINADGKSIANHRKLMLPPGFEQEHYTAGTTATIFTFNGIKCGILICYDIEFPETLRHLADQGVHCVLAPTALGIDWGVVSERTAPARAFENGIYMAYANSAGVENGLAYYGGSCIIGPDGQDIARAGKEVEILDAWIEVNEVIAAQTRLPYLAARKSLPWIN
jgi:predicted amidohydrolase